jgi:hypothetical protein
MEQNKRTNMKKIVLRKLNSKFNGKALTNGENKVKADT